MPANPKETDEFVKAPKWAMGFDLPDYTKGKTSSFFSPLPIQNSSKKHQASTPRGRGFDFPEKIHHPCLRVNVSTNEQPTERR